MNITIVIPTRNRAQLWATGFLWDWILKQTDQDFSVIVTDDMSTDNTCEVLSARMREAPFPCKLCRVIEPRLGEWQASPVSDNVAFRECIRNGRGSRVEGRGSEQEIVIHLDDDGRVHPELVATVRKLYTEHAPDNRSIDGLDPVYYGMIVYTDVEKNQVLMMDKRVTIANTHKVTRLSRNRNQDWGALWAAPLTLLKEIGGHEMSLAMYRGADARLGWQMHHRTETWFVAKEEMSFVHRGLSGYHLAMATGNDDAYTKNVRAPWLRDCEFPPVESNGGPSFWDDGFPIKYETVLLTAGITT